MNSVSVKVLGDKALGEAFTQIAAKFQQNAMRNACMAAARVFQEDAQARVRKKSGKTAEAIKVSSTTRRGGIAQAKVQLRGEHSYLGRFLEYGTTRHFLQTGDGGLSARLLKRKAQLLGSTREHGVLKIGNQLVSGAIEHPGSARFPFMRPAFDTQQGRAMEAAAAKLRGYLASKGVIALDPDDA